MFIKRWNRNTSIVLNLFSLLPSSWRFWFEHSFGFALCTSFVFKWHKRPCHSACCGGNSVILGRWDSILMVFNGILPDFSFHIKKDNFCLSWVGKDWSFPVQCWRILILNCIFIRREAQYDQRVYSHLKGSVTIQCRNNRINAQRKTVIGSVLNKTHNIGNKHGH